MKRINTKKILLSLTVFSTLFFGSCANKSNSQNTTPEKAQVSQSSNYTSSLVLPDGAISELSLQKVEFLAPGEPIPDRPDKPVAEIPPLNIVTLDGQARTNEDFKGRYVFLTFFATWCPHCQKELPTIDKLAFALKDNKDIVFVNVSIDNENIVSEIKNFVQTYSIKNMPMYRDADGRPSLKNFGISGVPTVFLINPEGKVIGMNDGEFDWSTEINDFKKYFK